MFEELFNPITINHLKLQGRLIMPAMNSHYGDQQHFLTDQGINYYTERARGEFALLITEFLCVSEEGLATTTQAGIYDDKFIPMLSKLTSRVHENGSLIFAQLHHSGRIQGNGTSNFPPVSASPIPAKGHVREIKELTIDQISNIKAKFVDAALRAKACGFDGVEIHGAHGYLLAQFLSKSTNKRTDEYGGSISSRAKIVCDIIREVKKKCGHDFPVSVRTSGAEGFHGGNTIEDAMAHSLLFEDAGADLLHISYGIPIQSYYINNGFNFSNIKKIKDIVSIPVIGVGRINDPALALAALKSGSMDLVALGRQSICDPHFPKKVRENRIDEIFVCTGCMQRCLYENSFEPGYGTSCMLNPFSGKEGLWEIKKTNAIKRIGIAGAGPAGLQAAWVLAKRGHQVKLYEKDSCAGGQYRLAAMPPMKHDFSKGIFTYLTLCQKYGVEICYNTEVTREFLLNEHLDEIIIATGSSPIIPSSLPGIEHDNVTLAQEILTFHKVFENQKILVLGAGLVGVETAEILCEYGNQVTIVDRLNAIAPLAPLLPRLQMLKHMEDLNIQSILGAEVLKINGNGIEILRNNKMESLTGFSQIILAFGSKPNNSLLNHLSDLNNVHSIGDAVKARDANAAIFEATQLALEL